MSSICILCFICVFNAFDAFLLDPSGLSGNQTGGSSVGNTQYLTLARYFDYQSQERQATQQMFSVLTSQLNNRFRILEGTNSISELKQNLLDLQRNMTELQQYFDKYTTAERNATDNNNTVDNAANLEHHVTELQRELNNYKNLELNVTEIKHQLDQYSALEQNLTDLKRDLYKYSRLEENLTEVQKELNVSNEKGEKMNKMLNQLTELFQNETIRINSEIIALQNSTTPDAPQTGNLLSINRDISYLKMETMNLKQTQLARSQDFLAFYNDTFYFKKSVNSRMDRTDNNINSNLQLIDQLRTNLTNEVTDLSMQVNTSLMNITDHIREADRKVAMTACAEAQNQVGGYIVKFTMIKSIIGFSNTSSFLTDGKLRIEHTGIYLLSISLTAYDTEIYYDVYVNDEYARVLELDNTVHYQRGAITLTLDLKEDDFLWVRLEDTMFVSNVSSCFTIVKVQ